MTPEHITEADVPLICHIWLTGPDCVLAVLTARDMDTCRLLAVLIDELILLRYMSMLGILHRVKALFRETTVTSREIG